MEDLHYERFSFKSYLDTFTEGLEFLDLEKLLQEAIANLDSKREKASKELSENPVGEFEYHHYGGVFFHL